MLFYHRGFLYIKRNLGKSILLFTLVFLLSTLMASAIVASMAIIQTQRSLKQQIPPIATIIQDGNAIMEAQKDHPDEFRIDMLTSELIENIGSHPHVRAFDYAIIRYDFFSYELNRVNDMTIYLEAGFWEEDIDFLFRDYAQGESELDQFTVKGVRYPGIADVIGGAITLVSGRTFTEEEILDATTVALIPYEFAVAHGLTIGDTFELSASIYETMRGLPAHPDQFLQDEILISETVLFEVIGIFTPNIVLDDLDWLLATNYRDLNNRIYVPIDIAKLPDQLFLQYLSQASEDRRDELLGSDFQYEDLLDLHFDYVDIIYILDDPLDIESFSLASSELLPEFWLMNDLTDALSDMMTSLAHMRQIATWIILGAAGACLVVLGLILILFFHDRRHEIGIYLALGERKIKIMGQLILEVMVVAHLALFVSFLMGYILADQMSTRMLQDSLLAQAPEFQTVAIGGINDFNQMGLGFSMSTEEVMESYMIALDMRVVFMLYTSGVAMVIMSTLIPLNYLFRLNPKKILTGS